MGSVETNNYDSQGVIAVLSHISINDEVKMASVSIYGSAHVISMSFLHRYVILISSLALH